jgi:hypothetical protein
LPESIAKRGERNRFAPKTSSPNPRRCSETMSRSSEDNLPPPAGGEHHDDQIHHQSVGAEVEPPSRQDALGSADQEQRRSPRGGEERDDGGDDGSSAGANEDGEYEDDEDDEDEDGDEEEDQVVRNPTVQELPIYRMVDLRAAVGVVWQGRGQHSGRMECLWVDFPSAPTSYQRYFSDFVNGIERFQRVSEVRLQNGTFSGWEEEEEEEGGDDPNQHVVDNGNNVDLAMVRLFGTVLPNHPSVTHIAFDASTLQLGYMALLTEGLSNNPSPALKTLYLESTPLTVEHARLLMIMLQHGNVQIEDLRLWQCGLQPDGLRLVCRGAAASAHLEHLNVRDGFDVPPGAVVPAIEPRTSLKQLVVEARSWSPGAFAELVEALRVNTRLVHAFLGQVGRFRHEARLVQDLVRTYNFSIQSVLLGNGPGRFQDGTDRRGPIGALLRRNRRVRGVVRGVLEPDGYRFDDRAMWPRVLQEIITFPTLLYRFVRSGNVDALADQLGRASRGRRRRRHQV